MAFKPASKKQAYLRMALLGPSGSGKSFTALRIAHALAKGSPIAAFDTERGSLSKYAGADSGDGYVFAFDVDDDMPDFDPRRYTKAIKEAEKAGYKVMVIDALSHAWAGPGGVLEFVDNKTASGNKFAAWKDATPMHNELVNAILQCKMHIIATMRTKMEHVQEKDANGRTTVRKIGMQPVQREGMEYEFDVIADMGDSAASTPTMSISKTRCIELRGQTYQWPGAPLAGVLLTWLSDGAAAPILPPSPILPEQHDGTGQVNEIKADCAAAIGRVGKDRARAVLAVIGRYCVRTDKGIQSIPADPDVYRTLREELASLA